MKHATCAAEESCRSEESPRRASSESSRVKCKQKTAEDTLTRFSPRETHSNASSKREFGFEPFAFAAHFFGFLCLCRFLCWLSFELRARQQFKTLPIVKANAREQRSKRSKYQQKNSKLLREQLI